MEDRRLLKLFAGPVLALALAACSAPSSAGVATLDDGANANAEEASDPEDVEADTQKWIECMRENGVDVPDATVDADGGFQFRRPTGGEGDPPAGGGGLRNSEDFEEAMTECGQRPRVAGAGPSEEDRAQMQERSLELAKCMRDEGIEDFPDPDFSNSGPGAGAGGRAAGGGLFGEVDRQDPEVQAAFEKCGQEFGGPGGAGRGPAAQAAD